MPPPCPQAAAQEDLEQERQARQQAEGNAAMLRKEFERRTAELQEQLDSAQREPGSIASTPPAMAGPGLRCAAAC